MECRIQFDDRNFEHFNWCKLDPASAEVSDSGSAHVDELKSICSETGLVTVFLPQQAILLTSALLPARASKQQINAIAFAIEEHLADDIENCFFAVTSQQKNGAVPVAVIDQQIMDDCTQLFSRLHINIRQILPPIYLCPWSDEEDVLASVCPLSDGYLVRCGLHEGLFCQSSILNQLLSLLDQQTDSDRNRLILFGEAGLTENKVEEWTIDRRDKIDLLSQKIDPQQVINLKQKQYQSTHQWKAILKHWKWPVAAMILLGLVVIASNFLDLMNQQRIFDELIHQQQSMLKQYLPDLATTEQPKKQLIKVLADNRSGKDGTGFMEMLHEYSQLKAGFKAIENDKIQYQQSRLVINLQSKDLKSLESFRAKLEKSQYPAEIENVNINPDKTTGRLVMQEP